MQNSFIQVISFIFLIFIVCISPKICSEGIGKRCFPQEFLEMEKVLIYNIIVERCSLSRKLFKGWNTSSLTVFFAALGIVVLFFHILTFLLCPNQCTPSYKQTSTCTVFSQHTLGLSLLIRTSRK